MSSLQWEEKRGGPPELAPLGVEVPLNIRLEVVRQWLDQLVRASDTRQFDLMVRVVRILRPALRDRGPWLTAAQQAAAMATVAEIEHECIRFAPRFASLRERALGVVDLLVRAGPSRPKEE